MWQALATIGTKALTRGMMAMSSMRLTEGPRRETREEAGSMEALRAQLSQQVNETAAAKSELANLTAYMTDQMAPMVDVMAEKAQQITHQLQLKEATIEQLTLQCQQKEGALQKSAKVSSILLIHKTAILTTLVCNAAD